MSRACKPQLHPDTGIAALCLVVQGRHDEGDSSATPDWVLAVQAGHI